MLDRVLRRPAISLALGVGLLVAAAVPILQMHTKLPSFTDLPSSLAIVGTYERVQKAFPGSQTPAVMVVKGDNVTTPAYNKAYQEFQRRALATGLLYKPFHVEVNKAKTVARIDFSIAGSGDDRKSVEALNALRNDVIPAHAARFRTPRSRSPA